MFSSKQSIRQIGLKDQARYLERLSRDKTIGNFDNIFLVHSYGDGYCPLYSAKIVLTGANAVQGTMCRNFWTQVKVSI